MTKLKSSELTRLRSTQDNLFNDECDIVTNVITQDDTGDEVETGTTHEAVDCGIDIKGGSKSASNGHTQIDYDAIIRLPLSLGFSIDINTTYVIVDKTGTTIGKTFRPVTFPDIGVSAQQIMVKEVTL